MPKAKDEIERIGAALNASGKMAVGPESVADLTKGGLEKKTPTVGPGFLIAWMERETGFEPATSTLARSHSTTELFPPNENKEQDTVLHLGYSRLLM